MSKEFDWDKFEDVEEAPSKKFNWEDYADVEAPKGIQYGKIAKDIGSSIPGAIGKTYNLVKEVPGQAMDLARYLKETPTEGNTIGERWENIKSFPEKVGRIGKSVGRGLFEAGKGAVNIDKNANEYLKSVGLPELIPSFGEELRKIGESENGKQLISWIEQSLEQGDRRPMDDLIEGLSRFAPYSAAGIVPGLGLEAIGQNENPLSSMLVPGVLNKGGKIASKVAGAVEETGKLGKNIGGAAKRVFTGFEELPGEISKAKAFATEQSNRMFNEALSSVKGKIEAPNLKGFDMLLKDADAALLKKIKANKFGTAEEMHFARSDLGQVISDLQRAKKMQGKLDVNQRTLFDQAVKARDLLTKSIEKALEKEGGPEAIKKYSEARKHFKEEVVPYRRAKEIAEFEEGIKEPETLIKDLLGNEEFMLKAGKKNHPNLIKARGQNALEKYLGIKLVKGAHKTLKDINTESGKK